MAGLPGLVQLLHDNGLAGLSPLLTETDSDGIFRTRDVVWLVELVLKGLTSC